MIVVLPVPPALANAPVLARLSTPFRIGNIEAQVSSSIGLAATYFPGDRDLARQIVGAETDRPAGAVAIAALAATLAELVTGAPPPDALTRVAATVRGLPQYLAMHGVRPVLVVPPSYDDAAIADTVVIGWDGRPSAARAVRTMLAASTPKNSRSAARVSLRPKPSVPRVT